MNKLQTAIEDIQAADGQETAFEHFRKVLTGYGYNRLVYSLMTDHHSIGKKAFHGVSTSYPEDWMTYYKENDYHTFDPVFQRILRKPGAFFWSDVVAGLDEKTADDPQMTVKAKGIMNEAGDAGLGGGFGVSFMNEFGEVSGIGISKPDADNTRNYQELAEVYLLSSIFHDKYMSFFVAQELPKLTPREREILLWSASGKTDWEIATISGISSATVRFHWGNIFKKLGVNNKLSATITAVRQKLIIPDSLKPEIPDS